MKPKVYIIGASGVGKTTLAKYISEKFGLPLLSGATALAHKELGTNFDQLFTDMDAADSYQLEVWRQQMRLEEPYWKLDGGGFVSDRSFDLMSYTARIASCAWQIARSDEFRTYIDRMRKDAICILIRRHPLLHVTPDGRRDRFLTPEWQLAVEGVVEYLLESNEIRYAVLDTPSWKDRVRTAEMIVSLASKV